MSGELPVWHVGEWDDGSTPDGYSLIFCDAWSTAISRQDIPTDIAEQLVEAHNDALATERAAREKAERERDEALAEIERMTPQFVAYEYLESPAGREMAEADNAKLRQVLKNIAEGNLGDAPWQANYDRIRAVALAALSPSPGETP